MQAGTALTDSWPVSLDGLRWLRTASQQHAVYFSCSGCQLAFPHDSNGNVDLATWIRDTVVHLAGHWNTQTVSAGTE